MSDSTTGFLLVDKPAGWTSFDVVAKLRSTTGIKKIGHAGTLDPFATGLLVVAVGREATKQIDRFVKQDKTYETQFKIGYTSTTGDPEGEIQPVDDGGKYDAWPNKERVEQAIKESFLGEMLQKPPMYSAIKIGGKKLYELARQGKEVERKDRRITIYSFDVIDYKDAVLTAVIRVSSGTYIRVIAQDLGEYFGLGAYCLQLRRTRIGDFDVKDAHAIDQVTKENWQTFLINNSDLPSQPKSLIKN